MSNIKGSIEFMYNITATTNLFFTIQINVEFKNMTRLSDYNALCWFV